MTHKKATVWSKLNMKKEDFDWIEPFMENNHKTRKSQSEHIKDVIRQLRFIMYGEEGRTGKLSEYEIRLFLSGKIFERILADGFTKKMNRKDAMEKLLGEFDDDD